MNYPLVQMTADEFRDIDERYNAVVKNTIELPLPASLLKNIQLPNKPRGGMEAAEFNDSLLTAEGELDEMHKKFKGVIKK